MNGYLSRLEKSADIGFKIFSIVAICFGGLRYFQERDEIARDEAISRSLSYIEDYGSARYVGARLALYDFWADRQALVRLLTSGGISDRVYQTALEQNVFRPNADDAIREALVLLDNFYSQVTFCNRTGLCNSKILNDFFCQTAQSEAVAYGPFFDHLATQTGDSNLGRDLDAFSESCTKTTTGTDG